MRFDYVIVQAGGKGSRMDYLTKNKPKALVPVNNRPMLFHLFEKYPDKKFIVIGDYKYDVLERYLAAFAGNYDYELVCASGHKGTCSGIPEALSKLPERTPFLLIWSDLMLADDFSTDELPDADHVFLSGDFKCRWKFENGEFAEEASVTHGVAGCFMFRDKSIFSELPQDGEFVRWLSEKPLSFESATLHGTKEYGLLSEYQKLQPAKCRPFNSIEKKDGLMIKRGIDAQGAALAVRETAWYRKVKELGFKGIPDIREYEPLVMEYVDGKNIYEYGDLPYGQKYSILKELVDDLKQLHSYASCPYNEESYYEAYIGKTFARLGKVRSLVPFADQEYITINGKKCRNVFYHQKQIEDMFSAFKPEKFVLLHGDCTFSNTMLRSNTMQPVFIDPRGYFGKTELYGDPAYDWAKLYYSLAGNYDMFNLKRFSLSITEDGAEISTDSSGWEDMEKDYFALIGNEVSEQQIRLIHAIIWLSLTTYAWEDYDSICGAFYKGILLLEEVL